MGRLCRGRPTFEEMSVSRIARLLSTPGCLRRRLGMAGLCALLLGLAGTSQAHHIWIEQDAGGARLYLGEFGENLRERSPGLLDKFRQLSARHVKTQGSVALDLKKEAGFMALAGRAAPGEALLAQEDGYPGWERKQGERSERHIWVPAARWLADFSARDVRPDARPDAGLTLDLLPTGTPGEFRAVYRGQVLPEAQVELMAASGWSRQLRADKNGLLRLNLPWRGLYALELKHVDRSGGERAGQRHEVASYVTTLSFRLEQGLEPPPPPPPSPPTPPASGG